MSIPDPEVNALRKQYDELRHEVAMTVADVDAALEVYDDPDTRDDDALNELRYALNQIRARHLETVKDVEL
jgi:hypothetical protein